MARLFGTDGVRGIANRKLSPELALAMGMGVAKYLHLKNDTATGENVRFKAVVGMDTRVSGDFLSNDIIAGLTCMGVDVVNVGVLPTPAIAYLTSSSDASLGVVISASHNPFSDNGIKFFNADGKKFPDSVEDEIEKIINEGVDVSSRPIGKGVGRVMNFDGINADSYIEHLLSACETDLSGLKIVIDCANGASSDVAHKVFERAGANVLCINNVPNGYNINDECGSTHPKGLQEAVVKCGADFGFAYDGDADRCLAVNSKGELVDGDKIMGILARSFSEKGKLAKNTLVVTVMSNLGLILAMHKAGIKTVQTAVGDRYVLEEMLKNGYNLGGEQSGHVISRDIISTGDGILTSLLLACEVKKTAKSLEQLSSFIKRLPQTLINVRGVDKAGLSGNENIRKAVSQYESLLADTGRVLLRPSGTEPLIRVMVEASTQQRSDEICKELAKIVERELAL